jgi:hypothetical protein
MKRRAEGKVTSNQCKAEFYARSSHIPKGKGWRETNAGQWRPTLYEAEEKSNMNDDLIYYRDGGHHFEPPEARCRHCGQLLAENRLTCEPCAWAAMPASVSKPKKLRQGERAEGQSVLDVPSLMIL